MGFFGDRLRAYPRYELYRLGVDTGLYPYYRPVESASRPRLTVETVAPDGAFPVGEHLDDARS